MGVGRKVGLSIDEGLVLCTLSGDAVDAASMIQKEATLV
jgi:hypothetical protein